MSTLKKILHASALSIAVGTAMTLATAAQAASLGGFHGGFSPGGGFHGGGGFHADGGFHGGVPEGGFRAGRDFDGRGLHGSVGRLDDGRTVVSRDHDWHRFGHWENGVWIGLWPGYYDDAYWSYYCDPASPYYNIAYCSAY